MTAPVETKPRSRRRLVLYAAGLVAVAAVVGLYFWFPGRIGQPEPPAFERAGVDPAVIRALDEKTEAVRRTGTARAWGELGMTFYIHDFVKQSLLCFRQAEKLQPGEARWPYYQAVALVPEKAIAKYQRAVQLCDNTPDAARLGLAEALLGLTQNEPAAEQFQLVLAQDADNARAHLGLARLAHERGDLDESLQHLSHSLEDKHTRKAAHRLLAQVQQERGEPLAAEHALRKVQKLPEDVKWPDPFFEEMAGFQTGLKVALTRARKLFREGHLDEAASLLDEVAQQYPKSAKVCTLLGKVQTQLKDLPAAEAALNKGLSIEPDSTEALFRLGVVYLEQGKPQDAAAKFRRAIDLQPGFGAAYYNLGHCLLKQGDRPAAIAALRSAVQAMPENVQAHRTLGAQLAEDGQYAAAIAEYQTALKIDPGDRRSRELLDVALKRKAN